MVVGMVPKLRFANPFPPLKSAVLKLRPKEVDQGYQIRAGLQTLGLQLGLSSWPITVQSLQTTRVRMTGI
jgi:hypothetical protein